jgi:hypothetical protein
MQVLQNREREKNLRASEEDSRFSSSKNAFFTGEIAIFTVASVCLRLKACQGAIPMTS